MTNGLRQPKKAELCERTWCADTRVWRASRAGTITDRGVAVVKSATSIAFFAAPSLGGVMERIRRLLPRVLSAA
jgi:hypothetical protein